MRSCTKYTGRSDRPYSTRGLTLATIDCISHGRAGWLATPGWQRGTLRAAATREGDRKGAAFLCHFRACLAREESRNPKVKSGPFAAARGVGRKEQGAKRPGEVKNRFGPPAALPPIPAVTTEQLRFSVIGLPSLSK
jgi:hypothetical protein